MKTVRLFALALLVLCALLCASCAKTPVQSDPPPEAVGLEYASNGDGTCLVSGIGTFAAPDLVIPPRSPAGDLVTGIQERAFINNTVLTSVTVSEGVSTIGRFAFYGCTALTEISIPNSVTQIGEDTFHGCTELNSITLGNGVTVIAENLFAQCSSLSSVVIPDNVSAIGKGAFSGCVALTEIDLPNSVKTIGARAFSDCSGLTAITVPDSVTSIGSAAFSGCFNLRTMTLPFVGAKAGVTSTDNNQYPFGYIFGTRNYTDATETAQMYWKSADVPATETYYIPSVLRSVTVTGGEIPFGAFSYCANLTSITLPTDVEKIGEDAFTLCTGLTSFTIPDSVTEIGIGAFSGCVGLTSFTIPAGVRAIGIGAFSSCPNLTTITVASGNTAYRVKGKCLIEIATKRLIWGCNDSLIPTDGSVTTIASLAFTANNSKSYVYTIDVPNGITRIDELAFYACTTMKAITLPASLESIGANAFALCLSLTSIDYRGKRADWNAIEKGTDWNSQTGDYTVNCTDGFINK